MRRRVTAAAGALVATALSLAACVTSRTSLPAAPVAAGHGVTIKTSTVALDPSDPGRKAVGDFIYAGGIAITASAPTPSACFA